MGFLKIHTSAQRFHVNLKTRTVSPEGMVEIPFDTAVGLYKGSPEGRFIDELGRTIISTGQILDIEGEIPAEIATPEPGNVVIRTQNSAYEIDQEQKLVRRLTGLNPSKDDRLKSGGWFEYESLHNVWVGGHLVIIPADGSHRILTTAIREIEGCYVDPPSI